MVLMFMNGQVSPAWEMAEMVFKLAVEMLKGGNREVQVGLHWFMEE